MIKNTILAAGLAVAALSAGSMSANAATVVVTNGGTTPNNLPLVLTSTGPGTYTGGSSDTITSAGNVTRNFSLNYNFTAPEDGMGSISFTTTSVAPGSSLLAITSAFFNGTPITIQTDTAANGAKTYKGEFAYDGALSGDPFTLTLNGTVRRGGTLSTSLSFAGAGVPEPATWALMILGFGAVGGAMRRRQATKAIIRFA